MSHPARDDPMPLSDQKGSGGPSATGGRARAALSFLAFACASGDAGAALVEAVSARDDSALAADVGVDGVELDESDADDASGDTPPIGDIELKRQNTGRGSPEESTKTTVRFERYFSGPVTLLRLDVPLPDDRTTFDGSPFDPRLGDMKARVGFAPFAGTTPVTSFLEVTAPTGETPEFGSGKWQLTPGVETTHRVGQSGDMKIDFGFLVQQDFSFAGKASAKDINYTKFEIGPELAWSNGSALKLTFKPAIDWVDNPRSGAVLELEGRTRLSQAWVAKLMLGGQLWNGGLVPSTYNRRVELTIIYLY
jgi:hypothetical protein